MLLGLGKVNIVQKKKNTLKNQNTGIPLKKNIYYKEGFKTLLIEVVSMIEGDCSEIQIAIKIKIILSLVTERYSLTQ